MFLTVSEQKLDSEVVETNFLLGRQMALVGIPLRKFVFPPVLTSRASSSVFLSPLSALQTLFLMKFILMGV